MPNAQADPFTLTALRQVDAYIAAHPDYTRQGVPQPGQGATNRVVFGRRGEERVVFKVFCERERKQREVFAFRHWRPTGLIPTLIDDVDETMIVMSHVPGVHLLRARQDSAASTFYQACYATGQAIGTLTRVPLSSVDRADFESRFYGELGPLEAYLDRIVELGRAIQARDADFQDTFWRDNLDLIESQLPCLYAQPRVLYHQDVSNLHVQNGRFCGFYDLEMCRVGCADMQLASALGMLDGDPTACCPFAPAGRPSPPSLSVRGSGRQPSPRTACSSGARSAAISATTAHPALAMPGPAPPTLPELACPSRPRKPYSTSRPYKETQCSRPTKTAS